MAALRDPTERRRARHVVTEQVRVRAMVEALEDDDAVAAGEILRAGHASLRDDFEVSTPVLDQLVDRLVALPGVHGARITGAGFGGSVVVLCDPDAVPTGGLRVHPAAGARVEVLDA